MVTKHQTSVWYRLENLQWSSLAYNYVRTLRHFNNGLHCHTNHSREQHKLELPTKLAAVLVARRTKKTLVEFSCISIRKSFNLCMLSTRYRTQKENTKFVCERVISFDNNFVTLSEAPSLKTSTQRTCNALRKHLDKCSAEASTSRA